METVAQNLTNNKNTLQMTLNVIPFWQLIEIITAVVVPIAALIIGTAAWGFRWYNKNHAIKNETQDALIEEHKKALVELGSKLDSFKEVIDKEFGQIKTQLQVEFKEIHRDIGKLTTQFELLQKDQEQKTGEVKELQRKLETLQEKYQRLELKIAEENH